MFKSTEQKTWKQAGGEINRCVVIQAPNITNVILISCTAANVNQFVKRGGSVLKDIPIT